MLEGFAEVRHASPEQWCHFPGSYAAGGRNGLGDGDRSRFSPPHQRSGRRSRISFTPDSPSRLPREHTGRRHYCTSGGSTANVEVLEGVAVQSRIDTSRFSPGSLPRVGCTPLASRIKMLSSTTCTRVADSQFIPRALYNRLQRPFEAVQEASPGSQRDVNRK